MAQQESEKKTSHFRRLWGPALLCLLLMLFEIYALFYDFDDRLEKLQTKQGPPIATYQYGAKDVRNKKAGTITWRTPRQGDTLHQADAIATMTDSEATVQFLDGSDMTIESQSLVVFDQSLTNSEKNAASPPQIIAKLMQGSVTRKTAGSSPLTLQVVMKDRAEPLVIRDDGKSTFRIENKGNGVKVHVDQGSLKLGDKVVNAHEEGTLSGDVVEVRETPPAIEPLEAPKIKKPRIRFDDLHSRWNPDIFIISGVTKKKIIAEFEWEPVSGATGYRLQVSTQDDFERILFEKDLKTTKFEYALPSKKEETLYYRVAALDARGNLGHFSDAMEIEYEEPPVEEIKKPPKPKRKTLQAQTKTIEEPHVPTLRLDLSLGAIYHSRIFKKESNPTTVNAKGFVPAVLNLDLRALMGQTYSLNATVQLIAEQGEPTTYNVVVETVGVPLSQARGHLEFPLGPFTTGFGPYVTTSYEFSWAGRRVNVKQKMLFGISAELLPQLREEHAVNWHLLLGLLAGGALGADLTLQLRQTLFTLSATDYIAYSGLFLDLEILARYTTIEMSYGGTVRLGYAF